jgi:hypothetical protein
LWNNDLFFLSQTTPGINIPGHESILWNWYRIPGIPGFTGSLRHRLRRKNPIGNFGKYSIALKKTLSLAYSRVEAAADARRGG